MSPQLKCLFLAVTVVVALSFDGVQAASIASSQVPTAVLRTGNAPQVSKLLSKVRRGWGNFHYPSQLGDDDLGDEFSEDTDDDDDDDDDDDVRAVSNIHSCLHHHHLRNTQVSSGHVQLSEFAMRSP